jgi:hypothetical protein
MQFVKSKHFGRTGGRQKSKKHPPPRMLYSFYSLPVDRRAFL